MTRNPSDVAKSLADLAVHHASLRYHLVGVDAIAGDVYSNSRDEHYLIGAALLQYIADRYDEAIVSVDQAGSVRCQWYHLTSNGHTYRCNLNLHPPR